MMKPTVWHASPQRGAMQTRAWSLRPGAGPESVEAEAEIAPDAHGTKREAQGALLVDQREVHELGVHAIDVEPDAALLRPALEGGGGEPDACAHEAATAGTKAQRAQAQVHGRGQTAEVEDAALHAPESGRERTRQAQARALGVDPEIEVGRTGRRPRRAGEGLLKALSP